MASDAYFPFADSVEIARQAGIVAVIQPGGSVRDKNSIDFCNANGVSMSFGFGKRLGSDVASELNGIVPSSELYNRIYGKNGWKSLTVISLAIGQGELGITPMQMANLATIMANRGFFYTPHLVKAIQGEPGIDVRFREKHKTLIDSTHFATIVDGMVK